MKLSKSLRPVVDYARQHGFDISRTRGGHLRISKRGCPPVFTSSTPSDWRSTRNALALLRRADSTGGG